MNKGVEKPKTYSSISQVRKTISLFTYQNVSSISMKYKKKNYQVSWNFNIPTLNIERTWKHYCKKVAKTLFRQKIHPMPLLLKLWSLLNYANRAWCSTNRAYLENFKVNKSILLELSFTKTNLYIPNTIPNKIIY